MRFKCRGVSFVYAEEPLEGDLVDPSEPFNESSVDLGVYAPFVRVVKATGRYWVVPHITFFSTELWEELYRFSKSNGLHMAIGLFYGCNLLRMPGYFRFSKFSKVRRVDGSYVSLTKSSKLAESTGSWSYYGWFEDATKFLY